MRSNLVLAVASLSVAFPVLLGAASPTQSTANNGNVVLEAVPEVPVELAESLRRYQNVRGASFQAWNEDGSSIYISTRFAEVNQLHRVDMPGGARRQLTFLDEPVRGTSRRRGTGELVFIMDEGGSEFFQIFSFDPSTGVHRRLTDGVSRNGSPSFSHDGQRMAYLSTRRNGSSNDVWVMDVDESDKARLLVEAPDGTLWMPGDWSPDGSKLLILNYVSITDSRIHVLDLATGEMTRVVGGWGRTGKLSWCRSDLQRRWAVVVPGDGPRGRVQTAVSTVLRRWPTGGGGQRDRVGHQRAGSHRGSHSGCVRC